MPSPSSSPTPPALREVGFWRDTRRSSSSSSDPRPLPEPAASSRLCASSLALLQRYLTAHAMVESFEHGWSYCRLSPCSAEPRTLGCASLTDGISVWPEGYAHYVLAHNVAPDAELLAQALAAVAAAAAAAGLEDCSLAACAEAAQALLPARNHLQWDASSRRATELPRGSAEWLRKHSSLQL